MTLGQRLKRQRTSGCIEDHFEALGKRYVRTQEDPNSNYLPKVRNDLFPIKNPYERILVGLIAELLYR